MGAMREILAVDERIDTGDCTRDASGSLVGNAVRPVARATWCRRRATMRVRTLSTPRAIKKGIKQVEGYRKELESIYGGKWTAVVDTYKP